MKRLKILRWQRGRSKPFEDILAEEAFLHVNINSEVSFDVTITPEQIRPFLYGHLLTEGFIRSPDDVLDYFEYVKGGIIHVNLRLKEVPERLSHRNYNVIWTGCGDIRWLDEEGLRTPKEIYISAEEIIKIPRLIRGEVDGFKQTGAYHYAFLFSKELDLVTKAKDIGRHNAVDKVIGEEILKGNPLDDRILFMTGRITMDIVIKCLRSGIPLVISRSAALFRAVELASKYNLGVIGFLRGERFNLYSGQLLCK
jgi:FdhD protein